jgi:2-keto-3-deoxy-L-rhamnonate aldolase RhmA
MSRMFKRFKQGDIALGAMMMEHGPEWIEILGYVGMDYGAIDMMNSSIDWSDAAEMVRACNRFDMTPRIRLQSYPWGSSEIDPRLQADVFRALGIGAEVIVASVNTAKAVEAMMAPLREDNANDWVHTRPYLNRPTYMSGESTVRRDDDRSTNRWVVPDLESLEALDNLDDMIEVHGLKAITLSLADISQAIGHPFDYRHPELMAIVSKAATKAAERDITVFAFAGGGTPDEVTESIERLWSAGVRGFTVPRPTVAAQRFYERMLRKIEDDNPRGRGLAVTAS